MATTTNYGWTTPDNTALVKDGASAIRTLGSSVDTSLKSLSPGTTAGDIDYYTSSTAKARLGIGTTGQVLTVAAGVPSWATASSGGMTLLSTTALSGTSVTVSSISQSYTQLLVIVTGCAITGGSQLQIRANGSTTLSRAAGYDTSAAVSYSGTTGAITGTAQGAGIYGMLLLQNYASATLLKNGNTLHATSGTSTQSFGSYLYDSATAVSSIVITNSGGLTMTAGSVLIYGVK
jgi:hypothetical protein